MTTKYDQIYQKSIRDKEVFWSEVANDIFWYKKPTKILNADNPPFYKWYEDGITNTCYNAVDLHVKNGNGKKLAIIYDSPITNSQKKITYNELKDQVSIFAGALVNEGIKKGDRVIIYMPMIPEAVIAMLACGRIGAIHSVVFGGFAANELASRIDDSKAKIILSASCGYEPGKTIAYKPLLKKAIELAKHKVEKCIIYQRKDFKADLDKDDIDWNDAIKKAKPVECVEMNANDYAYILYTSGTTGVPKGIVRDIGGHIVALKWTMKNIYNIDPDDVWWSASDIGWIVGHSYISKELNISHQDVKFRITELHEDNPMLGHRGCRLGISFPEIYEMQCQAIFEALAQCKKKKIKLVIPEIMIPLVSTAAEIEILRNLVDKTAQKIQKTHSIKIKYYVGTMIELPRAALRANDIAKYADFFSFGTNDLTQTTFGISRDDSGKFLNDYVENKIFNKDPFVSIDERGVGELIKIAAERGRKQKKSLKLGICGEHGGDPASIEFCEKAKLNYVSCSPYRVPIARLAAAQAYLKKK